jgi:hypothetical protein
MRQDGLALRWWLRLASQSGSFVHYSGTLTRKDRDRLDEAGFDKDDQPYVAVAKRSAAFAIVHEDSDFCKAESVVTSVCESRCMHAAQFLTHLDT